MQCGERSCHIKECSPTSSHVETIWISFFLCHTQAPGRWCQGDDSDSPDICSGELILKSLSTGSYKNHAMGDKSMFSDLLQILHRSWFSCQKWIFGNFFEIPWMPLPWQPYAIFGPKSLYFHQGNTIFCHIPLHIFG